MRNAFISACIAAAVSGCASQIMEGYMNLPLTDAVLEYGQPNDAFDMGDGRRAFTWRFRHGYVVPGNVYANSTMIGNSVFTTVTAMSASSHSFDCAYTVFARKARNDVEGPSAWMIVGYKKPSIMCE